MLRLGALVTALVAFAAIAGAYVIFGNESASAGADFIVTKQNDGNDGVCNNDCSLREAIQNANTDPGPDVIAVPPGTYVLTIGTAGEQAALTGDLDITSDITIQGSGLVTINANGNDHVFEILAPATLVTMTGINMTNADTDTVFGGAILIATAASLQLQNCSITGSVATDGGGGIAVTAGGSLSLNNCTLDNNKAVGNGGNLGGNLYTSAGSVSTLLNCTISNGESRFGAGAYVEPGGVMTVSGCTFFQNNAADDGGAIYNGGQAFLTNVTTDENHAGLRGGATFTTGPSAITNINNSTLAFDTGVSAEIHNMNGGTVNLHSTILRRTADPNCAGEPVNSQGYNLSLDDTCDLNATGDRENVDPLLLPLANNGGVTQTFLLGAGSQAINGGSPACPPPSTDQRGVSRPQGARCDIGAVEMSGAAPTVSPTATVTNTPAPTNTPGPTNTPFGRDMLFGDNDCDNDIDVDDVLNLLLYLEDFNPDQNEPCPEIGDTVTIIE